MIFLKWRPRNGLLSRPRLQEEALAISFGSINTGLPKDIVQQIMKAERIPLGRMEEKKGKIGDKKALVDQLNQLTSDLQKHLSLNANGRSLREFKVDTNNEIVNVTVDKNTTDVGNYQFEVMQLAQKSSAMSSGFPDRDDAYVGVGFVRYNLPDGESKEVYIGPDDATLDGIAKLINKDSESGMRATVINDGSGSDEPWRLVLSLKETGDDKKADFPYFYFVDGDRDLYLEFERPAQDAKIKLDGFEIEVPGNKVSDIIPGVTIDLKKAKPGEEFSLKIDEDIEAVGTKVTDLVTKINGVLSFIKQQNTMDETTDTSRTLGGDIMIKTLESRMRASIFQPIKTDQGNFRVGDIGITFTRDGILQFDEKKFEKEVASDYEKVSQILTGSYVEGAAAKNPGFMDNVNEVIGTALRFPDGLISARKKSLQSNIDQIDRRIDTKQRQLQQKETQLKNKFARLESTISNIKGQGAGLAALAANAGASPVTQLG